MMFPDTWWPIALIVGVACVLSIAAILLLRWRRRRQPSETGPQMEFVDVGSLPADGPPPGGRQLTCYGVPVRLAAVVVAASGRQSTTSPEVALREVLEAAVPGLADVAREHAPRVDRWPAQLSAHGFVQSFFAHLRLPGDDGKGTPWCSVAGRVEHQGQSYLLGVLCCADRPNSLGEITIEHAGLWLDVLRLRD